jgi:mannose-1-phosphate guanylyltransferase
MFHLYLVLNDSLVIEKNELLNFGNYTKSSNSESMEVPNIPDGLTINEFIAKTSKRMGDSFIKYKSYSWNCQHFCLNALQANNLDTPELKKFILQDAQAVLEKMPSYMESVSDHLTDVGGIARFFKEKVLGFKKGGVIFRQGGRRARRLM